MRRVTMLHQEPGPRTDDAHYASRCADELSHLNQTNHCQEHYACARDKPRNQITQSESHCADCSLQRRAKNIECKKIETQMGETCMHEERGEKTAVQALPHNSIRHQRADPMQAF